MGAWEELDTKISVEVNTNEIDKYIDIFDNDYTSEIRNCLENIKKSVEKGSEEGSQQIAIFNRSIQQELITDLSEHPYASGILGSSIQEEQIDNYTWLVGTTITHFYPLCVEYGRGEIRPVYAKVLFFYSLSGEPVFTKYVGPAPPKPFVAPAYDRTVSESENILMQSIQNNL